MGPTELKRYKKRLDELCSSLESTMESISAVMEEIQPYGENESLPAEGVELELAIERTEANLLHDVQAALDGIERWAFGRCVECGTAIPKERLVALPYAAYCLECERREEQATKDRIRGCSSVGAT